MCHLIALLLLGVSIIGAETEQIVLFDVRSDDNKFGAYFAKLFIPSLKIDVNLNATVNSDHNGTDNYIVSADIEHPIKTDLRGELNISISDNQTAKLISGSFRSDKLGVNVESDSRLTQHNNKSLISTNATIYDNNSHQIAVYNMSAVLSDTCPALTLSHNLTFAHQSLLYFSSNVTEECELHNSEVVSSRMNINITLQSQMWRMANLELRQLFHFRQSDGWESMNATHPLMDVRVDAFWGMSDEQLYFKKAVFDSKLKHLIPSFEISFEKYYDFPNKLILNILKDKQTNHNLHNEL